MGIRPTELGWKGIVLLAALGVAFFAAAYSNPFFLILVFCCTLGALGAAWTARNVRSVQVESPASTLIAAGEAAALTLTVATRGPRPAFALDLRLDLGDVGRAEAAIAMVRGRVDARLALPALPRGVHTARWLTVRSDFPFGLFLGQRRVPVACEIAVHPRILDAAALRALGTGDGDGGGGDEGDNRATMGRRGSSLRSLRPFRPGDAPSDVHWKATARRGAPIVKEREPEGAGMTATVVVDLRADDERLEASLSRAATTLVRAVEHGRRARLVAQGCSCTVHDRQGLARALRFLAGATRLPPDAPPPRPEGSRA